MLDSVGSACAPSRAVALHALADRIALSCECVVIAPHFDGEPAGSTHELLLAEAHGAAVYTSRQFHAQALAVVALGTSAASMLDLLASRAFEAHALISLCPPAGAGYATAILCNAVPCLCQTLFCDFGGPKFALRLA